jgi:secreted trypsin-like serine protease
MRSVLAVLLLACVCHAKPMLNADMPVASFGRLGIDNQIVGGQDAEQGKWVWQLSQQRLSGTVWSHSCGASLMSATKALSASHCVDGAPTTSLRVIAGLYQRTDIGVTSNVISYKMHEDYNVGTVSYANDISIMTLETPIEEVAGSIGYLTLPPDNVDQFYGDTCTITGWGRISNSDILPDTLQQADIGIISTSECNTLMIGVAGGNVWDGQICLFDTARQIGSCNGDSGGPCNCPYTDGYYVVGITSWGVSSSGNCRQDYPSVYTRTSYYLDWIAANSA